VPTSSVVAISGCSSATVFAFMKNLRQLITDSLGTEESIIGGPGIIVEVKESKLGKQKYNRGHSVEGIWVVGGIKQTPEHKVFIMKVADLSVETLLDVTH
jgi:hypothetical protein